MASARPKETPVGGTQDVALTVRICAFLARLRRFVARL